MAETFKNQVDALTGFANTEDDALSDWLTAGARSVLNILPVNKLERIATKDDFTSSIDVEGKKIISVLRKDAGNSNLRMPCRKLPPSMMGRVDDSNYMEAASTSDPAYIIFNNELNTFPASVASNDSRIVSINTAITVAHGDGASGISDFPDEAEYAVVLYAARQAVERKISDANVDEDVELVSGLTAQYQVLDGLYKEQLQTLQGAL